MAKLDEIDRSILGALQEDGRLSITELAAQVNLSHTPCLRRVKRLEADGVIRGYAAQVDQRAVGLPVNVFVNVTLERQTEADLDQFEIAIGACPEVMDCFLMTGSNDYLLRIVAADLEAYELFLKRALTRIPGIRAIQSSFALKQVVARTVLPLPA